jgi:formylmethanofuran dehydrogenase subunit D
MPVDVGKFLKAPEYEITITTFRDVFQSVELETENMAEYAEKSAVIYLGEEEMKKMNLQEGAHVKLATEMGSVVVKVKKSSTGIASMPNSPWCNALISSDSNGVPRYKCIKARLSLTKDGLTTLEELG